MNLNEIPPGQSQVIQQDGQEVALFNVEGRLYAVGNRCPHRSGPLNRGRVEKVADPASGEERPAVRCPIHGWLFDLATGQCFTRPSTGIPSFPVRCEDGQIRLG